MRRANEAIVRERHPIPVIDEKLEDMTGATVFSKLDSKWGYHQIELTPESRLLTTFVSHTGLWRYKRLMFGISSTPEIYQHIISQVLQGIPARETADSQQQKVPVPDVTAGVDGSCTVQKWHRSSSLKD